jgi:hypothetical protein
MTLFSRWAWSIGIAAFLWFAIPWTLTFGFWGWVGVFCMCSGAINEFARIWNPKTKKTILEGTTEERV